MSSEDSGGRHLIGTGVLGRGKWEPAQGNMIMVTLRDPDDVGRAAGFRVSAVRNRCGALSARVLRLPPERTALAPAIPSPMSEFLEAIFLSPPPSVGEERTLGAGELFVGWPGGVEAVGLRPVPGRHDGLRHTAAPLRGLEDALVELLFTLVDETEGP